MSGKKGSLELLKLAISEGDIRTAVKLSGEPLGEKTVKMMIKIIVERVNFAFKEGQDILSSKEISLFVANCPNYSAYHEFFISEALGMERPDIALAVNWYYPSTAAIGQIYWYCRKARYYSVLLKLLGIPDFPPARNGKRIDFLERSFGTLDEKIKSGGKGHGAEFGCGHNEDTIFIWDEDTKRKVIKLVLMVFADLSLIDGLKSLMEPVGWLKRNECNINGKELLFVLAYFMVPRRPGCAYAAYAVYKAFGHFEEVRGHREKIAKNLVSNLFYKEAKEVLGNKEPIGLVKNRSALAERYIKKLLPENPVGALYFLRFLSSRKVEKYADEVIGACLGHSGMDFHELLRDILPLLPEERREEKRKEYHTLAGNYYFGYGSATDTYPYDRALSYCKNGENPEIVMKVFKRYVVLTDYSQALKILEKFFPPQKSPKLFRELKMIQEGFKEHNMLTLFVEFQLASYFGRELPLATIDGYLRGYLRCRHPEAILGVLNSVLDAESWPLFAAGEKLKEVDFSKLSESERLLRIFNRKTLADFADSVLGIYQIHYTEEKFVEAAFLAAKLLDDLN